MRLCIALLVSHLFSFQNVMASEVSASKCFGSVANGRVENAVQLPLSGKNFQAYSSLTGIVGRNYVHSEIRKIVLSTYKSMETVLPDHVFVYGETGLKNGGRIRPHKTHKNGLSVDFMVPLLDSQGKSVPLPAGLTNKFGYDLEFDREGRYEKLSIDFEAIAEHLYQLKMSAVRHGYDLQLVIFDLPYLPRLYASKRGDYIRKNISFMQGKAWIRHDEHYHVDFSVSCAQNRLQVSR